MEKYIVNLNLIVLAIDKIRGRQYILSQHPHNIVLPSLEMTNSIRDSGIEEQLIKYLQKFIFTNELELTPQLINLHSKHIEIKDNTLNTVYGFVIDYTENINELFWIEFNYTNPNTYSLLIFETIQKLR